MGIRMIKDILVNAIVVHFPMPVCISLIYDCTQGYLIHPLNTRLSEVWLGYLLNFDCTPKWLTW